MVDLPRGPIIIIDSRGRNLSPSLRTSRCRIRDDDGSYGCDGTIQRYVFGRIPTERLMLRLNGI